MKKIFPVLFLTLALTACGKNPQEKFAEICSHEQDVTKRNSCICTASELAKQLNKERYERLVAELENAQSPSGSINFSDVIRSDALDQETITAFMSSAKKCGPQR